MVRNILPADRELFLTLTREFYASPAVLHDVPEKYHADAFDELMRSDDYLRGYILEVDGKTAGYGLTTRTYSHECGGFALWLEELYILPEFRSRGLGSEFFAHVMKDPSIRRFRLEVEPDNERAIALYRRLGYENLGYYQMVLDAQ